MSTFMQYDLATNFDEELIDFIVKHDTHKQIKSVFGKMRNDMAGGGRASFLLPEVFSPRIHGRCRELLAACRRPDPLQVCE